MWLVGIGSGLAAAAVATGVTFAVNAKHPPSPCTQVVAGKPKPSSCSSVNYAAKYDPYDHSEDYRAGKELGKTWPVTLFSMAMAIFLVSMTIGVAIYRRRRSYQRAAKDTSTDPYAGTVPLVPMAPESLLAAE
jgi:hypothetical protein